MDHLAPAKNMHLQAVPDLHNNGCVRRGLVGVIAVLGACRLGFDDLSTTAGRDCGIPQDLGSLGTIAPASAKVFDETEMAGEIVQLTGDIEADLSLRVELWDGYGSFAGGPSRTGTFELSGEETSAATCGVCAYLSLRIPGSGSTNSSYVTLLATGGVVDVTRLGSSGRDVATVVTALEFAEIDTSTSTPVPGGCTAALDDASLQAMAQSEDSGIRRGGHGGDGADTGDGDGGDGD